MDKNTQSAAKQILNDIGVTDRDLSLVSRVLNLKRDKRVKSVSLECNTEGSFGVDMGVELKEGFKTLAEFKAYLEKRGLPTSGARKLLSAYRLYTKIAEVTFNYD